jgi:hypothetical protein
MTALLLDQGLRDLILHKLFLCGSAQHHQFRELGGRKWSRAAVFKELKWLSQYGAIVRVQQRYLLRWAFVEQLGSYYEQARQSIFAAASISMIPAVGAKLTFHFSNLTLLDDFWTQAAMSLIRVARPQRVYEWVPIPWYELLHAAEEEKVRSALKQLQVPSKMIIGYDTPLSRSLTKRWEQAGNQLCFRAWNNAPSDRECLVIIGPYLLRITLDLRTTECIQNLCALKKHELQRGLSVLLPALRLPIRGKISIRHDAKKAQKLARELAKL